MRVSQLRLTHCTILLGATALGVPVVCGQTADWPRITTIGYTVPSRLNTGIYVRLVPNAVCRLREILSGDVIGDATEDADTTAQDQPGSTGEAASAMNYLKLFSDADGNARFFVQPPVNASADVVKLLIRCASASERAQYLVGLRASNRALAGFPFPPAIDPALSQSNQTVLPPLRDPTLMTDEDLVRAGYPLRPDPSLSPAEYAAWLTAVSKPISVVTSQAVTNVNVYHSQLVSNTWSGDVVNPQQDSFGFAEPYVGVTGQWTLPKTLTGELFRSSAVSQWIGLDGTSASPLIQAGTGQHVLPVGLVPYKLGQPWIVSSYNAWTEVFPLQPEQSLSTFAVHPGDTISGGIWISWDDMKPTATGGFAFFQLFNFNTNQVIRTSFQIAFSDFTVAFDFLGHDAEWIVERPSIGPDPNHLTALDLANYHSQCLNSAGGEYESELFSRPIAWMQTGAAGQYDKRLYNQLANDNIAMFAGLTYLSGMYPANNSSMCFQWFNFH